MMLSSESIEVVIEDWEDKKGNWRCMVIDSAKRFLSITDASLSRDDALGMAHNFIDKKILQTDYDSS